MQNKHQRIKDRVIIFLDTRDEGQIKVLIDAEDLPKAWAYNKWRLLRGRSGINYVVANPWKENGKLDTSKAVFLSRLVMGLDAENTKARCGYVNDDTMDCRKQNLFLGRLIDITQKRKPQVYEVGGSWKAEKRIYGKHRYFGSHATKAEAEDALRKGTIEALRRIGTKGLKDAKDA